MLYKDAYWRFMICIFYFFVVIFAYAWYFVVFCQRLIYEYMDIWIWKTRAMSHRASKSVQRCGQDAMRRINKKAVLSQRWPRNAPYIWVPGKFSGLPDYVHGHYSQYFHRLLFRSTIWMFLHNLKSVALPVAEIIGGTQKNWAVSGYAHAPFSEKFLMGFYSDRLCKYTRQIWSP